MCAQHRKVCGHIWGLAHRWATDTCPLEQSRVCCLQSHTCRDADLGPGHNGRPSGPSRTDRDLPASVHGRSEKRDPMLVERMRLDAAIAEVTDPALVTSWQGDGTSGFDTPANTAGPASGLRVKNSAGRPDLPVGRLRPSFRPHGSSDTSLGNSPQRSGSLIHGRCAATAPILLRFPVTPEASSSARTEARS